MAGMRTGKAPRPNQLTSSYDQQAVTTSYSYNANGALTQQSNPQATTSYSYNGLDKLTQVTTPATTVGYSYDALGRRITRTDTNGTINYQLDGKSDLTDFETDGNGKLTGAYLRGADGLISQTDYTGGSPITSGYLYNPHGDTSATTDENGNVTGTYRYDSFGNPIGANSLVDAYTGKWQRTTDDATGLIKMGAREYDLALGRFTSPDSFSGDPSNSQQLNRYSYVGNEPLVNYDLTGFYWGESVVNGVKNHAEDVVFAGEVAVGVTVGMYVAPPAVAGVSALVAASAIAHPDSFGTDLQMFEDWATGMGPSHRDFGPDIAQVRDMQSSFVMEYARKYYYEQWNAGRNCGDYVTMPNRGMPFGESGALDAGLNPTQQFVGGADVQIIPNNQNRTLTIMVTNNSTIHSFFYDKVPKSFDYNRINIGGIELPTPGATTSQTFTWTEPMR